MDTPDTEERLKSDIKTIGSIAFLPALLDIVCIATGLGFAAVARVTEERWIAGAVLDKIQFGLLPGGELPVETTICNEMRDSKNPVVIEHVSHHVHYCKHHTPAMYGFESYISYPIIRQHDAFYGTLCAIDPRAAELNTPAITELFTSLVNLIARYLDGMATHTSANMAKMEMYASAELNNLRRDITPDGQDIKPETIKHSISQLSLKLNQLLMAFEPGGSFLA